MSNESISEEGFKSNLSGNSPEGELREKWEKPCVKPLGDVVGDTANTGGGGGDTSFQS
ncbi:hypothetical protein [Pelagicoccus mobilis]|uniref:Uncharacterized protein n=1 Tax=Pelagicoccus mobilis TaxID=415221 RepID=A0A934RY31_9BACT|nr:hypothetical protein [Pelagicoccus mobilis]MBK1875658.1 hypothetical protein [Pelagicoccus mobilis]